MTIKIISNAPTATPSTSLFKQPGSANAGAIDLFSSLLGGQLGELDTLLGDTLNKSTLQSEDAALSPLARKLKALKNTPEITQEATTPPPPPPPHPRPARRPRARPCAQPQPGDATC